MLNISNFSVTLKVLERKYRLRDMCHRVRYGWELLEGVCEDNHSFITK